MKYLFPSSLLALALAGCASAPAPQSETTAAANDVYCERETPTGSMRPKTNCRSAEQRAADRAGVATTSEAIRNQRSLPPGK